MGAVVHIEHRNEMFIGDDRGQGACNRAVLALLLQVFMRASRIETGVLASGGTEVFDVRYRLFVEVLSSPS